MLAGALEPDHGEAACDEGLARRLDVAPRLLEHCVMDGDDLRAAKEQLAAAVPGYAILGSERSGAIRASRARLTVRPVCLASSRGQSPIS